VNPTVYTPHEFKTRAEQGNPFLMRVLAHPRLWIIGSDDELPAR